MPDCAHQKIKLVATSTNKPTKNHSYKYVIYINIKDLKMNPKPFYQKLNLLSNGYSYIVSVRESYLWSVRIDPCLDSDSSSPIPQHQPKTPVAHKRLYAEIFTELS